MAEWLKLTAEQSADVLAGLLARMDGKSPTTKLSRPKGKGIPRIDWGALNWSLLRERGVHLSQVLRALERFSYDIKGESQHAWSTMYTLVNECIVDYPDDLCDALPQGAIFIRRRLGQRSFYIEHVDPETLTMTARNVAIKCPHLDASMPRRALVL